MNLQNRIQPLIHLWMRLTEPHASVQHTEERQNARVLSGLLLLLALLIAVFLPARYLSNASSPYTLQRLLGAGFGLGAVLYAYGMARRGQYQTAGKLVSVGGSLAIFISAAMVDASLGASMLYYLLVVTLFSSLFLSFFFTFLMAILHILGMLALPFVLPTYTLQRIIDGPANFNLMVTLIALAFAAYRTWLERQRAARLMESENRYRMISELISDYAFGYRVEPDGSLVPEWMTDSFKKITGYHIYEMATIRRYGLYHPDEWGRVEADLKTILNGQSHSAEYRIITKHGQLKWIELYRQAVWDAEHKRVVGFIGVAQDITERKRSEADRLNTAVQQERLRLFGGFMEAVSHDFRTSLATIETNRYLLAQTISHARDDKTAQRLDTIHQSVNHMADQLGNLHTLSALVSPNMCPYNILPLVQSLVEGHRAAAASKQITLSLNADTQTPLVLADGEEIKRALKHLLVNAISYTPEGGTVAVRTYQHGGMLSVEIGDTGIGIPPQDISYIFDFFYRADSSRPTELGGVGLGLSIVKMIAETHNGRVTVDSQPGQGSVFTFSLPVIEEV